MDLMRRANVDSVAVVKGERLVGIVTAQDLLQVSLELFERALREGDARKRG